MAEQITIVQAMEEATADIINNEAFKSGDFNAGSEGLFNFEKTCKIIYLPI